MMNRLAIIGASGHAKVIINAALLSGWKIDLFDDSKEGKHLESFSSEIIGNTDYLIEKIDDYDGVIIGIGNNEVRKNKYELFQENKSKLVNIIHPSAQISPSANLGTAILVVTNAIIHPDASIGDACIINTASIIEHDCKVGSVTHIAPGAILCGGVKVGSSSHVGAGSVVKEGVKIGSNVIIGAGSTVINDIPDNEIVAGSPARPLSN